MNALRPTTLLDAETLVDRAHEVALIAESLRLNPVWTDAGDTGRRTCAHRIAFARWRVEAGELTDEPGGER